jgi:hypothetical protein
MRNFMTETIRHKLTPTDILNIFIEQHRLCSPLDPEADPWVELTFASTINDWRAANDLLPWQPLSKFLNDEFNINASQDEWEAVLTPASLRTLKDVCELVSKHSTHSDIEPKKLLGQECLSAAVFLTLKKYLQIRQVDVSNLKPSSSVTAYLDNYYSAMVEQTTIIANGNQVFDKLEAKRTKKGFLNYINIFDKNRYTLTTGDIKTFRDLTIKIIEVNADNKSSA